MCRDSAGRLFPSKTDMLRYQLLVQAIDGAEALYVGDRPEDGDAACRSGLSFCLAGWADPGSLDMQRPSAWVALGAPHELVAFLMCRDDAERPLKTH
jgi:phosphoglycolate phosphatase-like HAD superfamily hydrolase